MERTHVYKVPEEEIDIKPIIYLGYLDRYGQVQFEVSESTYLKVKEAWNQFGELWKANKNLTETQVRPLLEQYDLLDDHIAYSLFTFLIAALGRIREIYTEPADNGGMLIVVRSRRR